VHQDRNSPSVIEKDGENMRGTFCLAVIAGVLAGYLCTPVFADQIKLKNGNFIEGEIINETPDELALQIPGGLVYFNRSEISGVIKTPKAAKTVPFVNVPVKKTPTKTHPYFSEISKVLESGILTIPDTRKSFSRNGLTVQQQNQIETVHNQAAAAHLRQALDPQLFRAAMMCVLFGAVYGGFLTKVYLKLRKFSMAYTKTFLFMFWVGLIAYVLTLLSIYVFPASLDILVGPYAAMSRLIYLLCKVAGAFIGIALLIRISARTLSLGFFDTIGLTAFTIFFTWLLFFVATLFGVIPGTNILETFSS